MKRYSQGRISTERASFVDVIARAMEKSQSEPEHVEVVESSQVVAENDDTVSTEEKTVAAIRNDTPAPTTPAGEPYHLTLKIDLQPPAGSPPPANELVILPTQPDGADDSKSATPRRRFKYLRTLLGLTLIAVIPLAAYYSFQSAPVTAAYPLVIDQIGTLVRIPTPNDGIVTEVAVVPGQYVHRNELLLRIREHPHPQLLAMKQEQEKLSIELSKLQNNLAASNQGTIGAAIIDSMGNSGALSNQEWPQPKLSLQTTHLDSGLTKQLEQAEQSTRELQAEIAATRKQLRAARSRLGRAKSLYEQGVVYDEGVYTLAQQQTLQATLASLAGELKLKEQALEESQTRVRDLKQDLQRQQEIQTQRLVESRQREFDRRQRKVDALGDRIREEELKIRQFSITAPADGLIETENLIRVGNNVNLGTTLIHLREYNPLLSIMVQENANGQKPQLSTGTKVEIRLALAKAPHIQELQGTVTAVEMRLIDKEATPDRSGGILVKIALEPSLPATLLRELSAEKPGEITVPLTDRERLHYLVNRAENCLQALPIRISGWFEARSQQVAPR